MNMNLNAVNKTVRRGLNSMQRSVGFGVRRNTFWSSMNSMNRSLKNMNPTIRTVGLVVLAVGALAYPTYRLIKFLMNRRKTSGAHNVKAFGPSYRAKNKPHRRKAMAGNGHFNQGLA